jgi:hypothetical protein
LIVNVTLTTENLTIRLIRFLEAFLPDLGFIPASVRHYFHNHIRFDPDYLDKSLSEGFCSFWSFRI